MHLLTIFFEFVPAATGTPPMLNTFHLILLEHIAMCRLVMGNRTTAIKEVYFNLRQRCVY